MYFALQFSYANYRIIYNNKKLFRSRSSEVWKIYYFHFIMNILCILCNIFLLSKLLINKRKILKSVFRIMNSILIFRVFFCKCDYQTITSFFLPLNSCYDKFLFCQVMLQKQGKQSKCKVALKTFYQFKFYI